MQSKAIIHPWIDDSFFEKGSFITTDDGKMVLLLKGGEMTKQSLPPAKRSMLLMVNTEFQALKRWPSSILLLLPKEKVHLRTL